MMRLLDRSRIFVACLLSGFFFAPEISAVEKPLSVYRIDPTVDSTVIGVSAAVNLVPTIFASSLIDPRCPCSPTEVNAIDRGVIGNHSEFANVLSDVKVAAAMIVPVTANAFDLGFSPEFWEDFVVFSEALLVSGALTTTAKYLIQRPLPVIYSGDDPSLIAKPGGYRSFFSGHTATAFAALSVASMTLHYRYQTGAWPWVVTAAVGTSVAVERVLAGRHFYSDVVVGAVVGTGIGILIPWMHRRAGAEGMALSIRPSLGGATLVGRF